VDVPVGVMTDTYSEQNVRSRHNALFSHGRLGRGHVVRPC